MVFINLYWKDDRSGKTGAFCKHKSNSLHNQAIDVIYIVYQEAAMMTDIGTYYSELHRPVRRHLTESGH